MNLLGLDFESSGLDRENDRVIEYGLVMWNVELRQPVRMVGNLVKPEKEFTQEQWAGAEAVHGISMETVNNFGMPETIALKQLLAWYQVADVIIAHNGNLFDRPMLEAWVKRASAILPDRPWIDTRVDLPRPLVGKLIYLAADFGFVNPFPHRALFDAMSMMRILDNFDIPAVIERSKLPNVLVEAVVSFNDKDKAKNRGYHWDDHAGKKKWVRNFKDCDVERERAEAGFPIKILEVQQP